jgi:hypothetical protein
MSRGKRTRDEYEPQSGPSYDPLLDDEPLKIEVASGEGKIAKLNLSIDATVADVKAGVEGEWGFSLEAQRLYLDDREREGELKDGEERLQGMRRAKEATITMTVLVEEMNASAIIPTLSSTATHVLTTEQMTEDNYDTIINDTIINDDCFHQPHGVAWVPSHADWLVTTEREGHRVKITNVCTGTLICKYGTMQSFGMALDFNAAPGNSHFNSPKGVAVTPDSSFVLVCDSQNDRVQMLRLVVCGNTAHLEFVRSIGSSSPPNSSELIRSERGEREGYLVRPAFVALLPGAGGQQTMLITDTSNKGVSQFELDGTFIRIFAGEKDEEKDGGGGASGSRPSRGQLDFPNGITVLASSGEVAITLNNQVQIFDRKGNFKRQFGTEGTGDGQFSTLDQGGLASDACGNILIVDYGSHRLQVFNAQGTHLCTRNFGIGMDDYDQVTKAIAWSTGGRLALATCGVETDMGAANPGVVRVWYQTGSE